MIESLQDFTASLPPWLQWFGVMVAGGILFVESYFGSVVGIVAGVTPPLAVAAAVVGNIATMLVMVLTAHGVRRRVAGAPNARSPRRQRLGNAFDKYGVAAVSLLGQSFLPSQITSAALISFGAPKKAVIFWHVVSITLWGVTFGALATLGIDLLAQ